MGKENNRIEQYNERFIFIHIPRTGGTSVKNALGIFSKRHKTLMELRQEIGRSIYRRSIVTIVRNPVQRFISAFNYCKDIGVNMPTVTKLLEWFKLIGFNYFDTNSYNQLFMPQYKWLTTDTTGFIKVDFIARYEEIDYDYIRLAEYIELTPGKLRRRNESGDYKTPLTLNNKDMIRDIYSGDFSLFGY